MDLLYIRHRQLEHHIGQSLVAGMDHKSSALDDMAPEQTTTTTYG